MPSLLRQAITAAQREVERAFLIAAIDDADGDVLKAAAELGLCRASIYNKMARYGITRARVLSLRTMPPVDLSPTP